MRFKVSALYRSGRNLGQNKVAWRVAGDLNIATSKSPMDGRLWTAADLFEGDHQRHSLHGVTLQWLAADGFLLRGFEYGPGGREQAQEWYCVPEVRA